jgi:DNA polymerase elongation subunit (family B)
MRLFEATYKVDWDYYERYFDTDLQQSVSKKIQGPGEYYAEHPKGTYKYILDESITLERRFGKPTGIVYGKIAPDIKHIRDTYWDIKESKYNLAANMWYLDIETTAYNKINVDDTPEEVVLMQIFDTSKKLMIILSSREWKAKDKYINDYGFTVKHVNCKDEFGIFNAYFDLLAKLKPLIVLGWNTNGFDYPYLFNRATKLGLDTDKFSPFGKANLDKRRMDNGMLFHTLKADGIFYLDYLEVYKKYTYKPRASYSLDNISKVELGEGKIDHSCYSTFDGFRTGDSYIFPEVAPTDEWGARMLELQTAYRDTQDESIKAEISEHANDLFVHYGIIDTYLVKQLDDKLQLSKILLMIASKMGINIDGALGTVKPWASYITNVAHLNRKILPNLEVKDSTDTSIKGGYVADPETGKHKWVISVDINSAYPNLSMRGFNMSPETYEHISKLSPDLRDMIIKYFKNEDEEARFKMYLEQPEIFKKYTDMLKRDNLSGAISGAVFTREHKGIVPTLVENIYSERKIQKGQMLDWKQKAALLKESHASKEDVEHAVYMTNQFNTSQMVSKVLINSLYGALGNQYFQLFNIEIARAITANTRFYIHLLRHRVNDILQAIAPFETPYYKYSDTDSVYFGIGPIVDKLFVEDASMTKEELVQAKTEFCDKFVQEVIDPCIEEVNFEFADMLNAYDASIIKTEREAISDVSVFLAKKKYFMRVYDMEGVRYQEPDMKTMGIEIVRSSTPPFVKKYLLESINIIMDGDADQLITWVDNVKEQFTKQPLQDIAKTTGIGNLNYDLAGTFKDGKKVTIPINSRAAIATNNHIEANNELAHRYSTINAGDKVKLLYLREPNPIGQNVFAFIDPLFSEKFREHVDYDLCWEKYFMSSLNIMVNPLNWNINKRTEILDEW